MTILATAVVLGVLIFVHELGHFWAARAVDIEVERFSIGL
ncbi:MAG TPA: RIP metalloprotease RseP, partial [Gemmatimonadetes bacterium]|nr:RIP metalloprotease RseP [Gemmatimonadota bacterium]